MKPLRCSDLARFCAVDQKTIHNWANKGQLPHFRTPGRHLRFRPAEVAAFLASHGFDVPAELAPAPASTAPVAA